MIRNFLGLSIMTLLYTLVQCTSATAQQSEIELGINDPALSSSNEELLKSLRFTYSEASFFGFDNWQQITKDFEFSDETFWSGEWADVGIEKDAWTGKIDSSKCDKDHLGFYTGMLDLDPEFADKHLGFKYPNIKWCSLSNGVICYGLSDNFDPKSLLTLPEKIGYALEKFEGLDVYIDTLFPKSWKDIGLQPKHQFANFCYIPTANVLACSYYTEQLLTNLYCYVHDTATFYNDQSIQSIVKDLDSFQNLAIVKGVEMDPIKLIGGANVTQSKKQEIENGKFVGLSKPELESLSPINYYLVAEFTNGKVISTLNFDSQKEAQSDLSLRLSILENGKFFTSGRNISTVFRNARGKIAGNNIVFQLETTRCEDKVTNALYNRDLPWTISPKRTNKE